MDETGANSLREPLPEEGWLPTALLFAFITHAVAMMSMGLLLLPGMPGGSSTTMALCVAYIAAHPWLWRLGWLGWQITALSDLLLALALAATRWIPKPASTATLALTLAALIPDQLGQFLWTWKGPVLAQAAIISGSYGPYLALEQRCFHLVAGWGTVGYLSAALGWTWCFAAASVWSRRLTWLSVCTWGLFVAATGLIFLPATHTNPALGVTVSVANAIAFVLLLVWLAAVTERVLRRSRPVTTTGSAALWKHPSPRLWARGCEVLANSRFARRIGELLPILPMASDIQDVIYVNYLVPAKTLEPRVPPYLTLQYIGRRGEYAMFTFLSYRHGHFGPIALGPLRRLWPSPIQSNWRIYVVDPQTAKRGVHFVTTAITSTPHALATRLLSEGVPMHVPAMAAFDRTEDGTLHLNLQPGRGSAPDMKAEFRVAEKAPLPRPWNECFESWERMLAYCVPQDRALAAQPWYDRVVRQEIDLGIPLSVCVPLAAEIDSTSARAIVGDTSPLCFWVPRVAFRFDGEGFDMRRR